MDLRPQAHDIIRTWLFSTVVRAHFEHGAVPWSHAAISGFVVDPDRKKMSKSKGNVVDADRRPRAVRHRRRPLAGPPAARPGADSPFDEAQMKVGRRLAIKILNVGKFVLGLGASAGAVGRAGHRADRPRAAGARWPAWSTRRPRRSRRYNYTRALEVAESFFWSFCDDYVELVKSRAYGVGRRRRESAQADAGAGAVGAAAAVRAGAAVRHRGGLVVVAGRVGAPRRVAGRRRAARRTATRRS